MAFNRTAMPPPASPVMETLQEHLPSELMPGTDAYIAANRSLINKPIYDEHPLLTYIASQGKYGNDLTPEMYNYWGGDEMLKEARKYDPDAHWIDVNMSGGGGESESAPTGKRLILDKSKLPKPGVDFGDEGFIQAGGRMNNEKAVYNDPIYGPIMSPSNKRKESTPWWVYAAPIAIGALAPMAGAAMYGAGIGVGAAELGAGAAAAGAGAGTTSAVTGAMAGLPAGMIPGAAAAGGVATGSTLNAIRSGINTTQSALRQGGNFNPYSLVGPALGLAGGAVMPYLRGGRG